MEIFTLGERLMVYRKRCKLTKKAFADMCGASVATISRYEDDMVDNYDVDLLMNMAMVLNVSIHKLIIGVDDVKKKQELMALINDSENL